MRTYHPDPEINAEIIERAAKAEELDMAAGYPPRWWVCPECEAAHKRGHFGVTGNHHCLRCGYAGNEGTTHINDPRPHLANEQAQRPATTGDVERNQTKQ